MPKNTAVGVNKFARAVGFDLIAARIRWVGEKIRSGYAILAYGLDGSRRTGTVECGDADGSQRSNCRRS